MSVRMNETLHSEECKTLIKEIDTLAQRLAQLPSEAIIEGSHKLNDYRKISSNTLKKTGEDFWLLANLYVSEKVQQGLLPQWHDIVTINKIIQPNQQGLIRNARVWVGNHETCAPETLEPALKTYQQSTLINKLEEDPLIWASRVRYDLVTLNPFADGNGRTSNLICDWILAVNGFLPITHSLKTDSHIGGWKERAHFSDFEFACFKTLNAILHSYMIFFDN